MRFKTIVMNSRGCESGPKVNERIVCGFLWLPKRIDGEWRWLESAAWLEKECGDFYLRIRWVDSAEQEPDWCQTVRDSMPPAKPEAPKCVWRY